MVAPQQRCDVAVVGAGPAGAAAARALAADGLEVTLVEENVEPVTKPGEVLTPNAIPVLSRLQLLTDLDGNPDLAYPLTSVERTWGAHGRAREHFLSHRGGRAWVLHRAAFERSLLQGAQRAGVKTLVGYRLRALRKHGQVWSVDVANEASSIKIGARFLIDATGRRAVAARRLGARRRRAYRLVALHLQLCGRELIAPPQRVLSIEAVAGGWWYAVSGPAHTYTCAFMTDPGSTRPDPARTVESAAAQLCVLPSWCMEVVRHGRLQVADASPAFLEPLGGNGWLAVRDAAASFDPVTSQGIPNACASGVAAAAAVVEHLGGSRDAVRAFTESVINTWVASAQQVPFIYRAAESAQPTPFWATKSAQAG